MLYIGFIYVVYRCFVLVQSQMQLYSFNFELEISSTASNFQAFRESQSPLEAFFRNLVCLVIKLSGPSPWSHCTTVATHKHFWPFRGLDQGHLPREAKWFELSNACFALKRLELDNQVEKLHYCTIKHQTPLPYTLHQSSSVGQSSPFGDCMPHKIAEECEDLYPDHILALKNILFWATSAYNTHQKLQQNVGFLWIQTHRSTKDGAWPGGAWIQIWPPQ